MATIKRDRKAEICASKKVFWSYEAAKRAAKRREPVYGARPRSYKCDNCQLWHHTTKPPVSEGEE